MTGFSDQSENFDDSSDNSCRLLFCVQRAQSRFQEIGTPLHPNFKRRTKHREPGTKAAPGAAFTLLEVILAMGIVTMLVLMIANMFREASLSWNVGMQSAEMNSSGRAAADFVARELAQAVAGPIEAANPGPPIQFLLAGNRLTFVALSGDPDQDAPRRALRGVTFEKVGDTLKYGRDTSFNPYSEPPSPSGGGIAVLAANIQDFQVRAYAGAGGPALAGYNSTDPANSNRLPAYVDIYLELLSDDDAKKAAAAPDPADFIDRNARRYATRVYFNNRMGYGERP